MGKIMKITILLLSAVLFGCSASRPAHLGMTDGKFQPCPDSPNCVSSQSPDKKHFIEPIHYGGTQQQAKDRLMEVIQGMKRSKIVTDLDHYIHAEFTSTIFRFVDDIEFLIDDRTKIIHLRSASRIGYSDFGVNRKRMEELRLRFLHPDQT
jgi:uncharacterized protein (DUF1499 family)